MKTIGLAVFAAATAAAQPVCSPRDLLANDRVEAALESSDCRYRDVVASSPLELRVDLYRIKPERRGVVTLELRSTAFPPVLTVLTTAGRMVAQQPGSPAGVARIVVNLDSQSYIVLAGTRDGSLGAYTLASSFEDPRVCATPDLEPGATVQAALEPSDCRVVDLIPEAAIESLVDRYRVRVEPRSVLTFAVATPSFPSLLVLMTEPGLVVQTSTEGRLKISLEAGTYFLLVTTEPGAGGAYALRAEREDIRRCEPKDIGTDETAAGELVEADCRLLDLIVPDVDETRYDPYRLTIPRRGILTADLTSTALDAFLILGDGTRFLAADDDSGGGTNSRIRISLNPGTYFLFANSFEVEAGAYTLKTSFEDPRVCDVGALAPDQPVTGTLAETDCRVLDTQTPSRNARPADAYRLVLDERRVVTIELTPAQLENHVILLDANNATILEGPRIDVMLNPGTYTVLVTFNGTRLGGYTVSLRTSDPPQCAVGDLVLGATREGEIAAGDCRVRDHAPGTTDTSL
ncbi:MAG: hypothetical protein ACRD96_09465, partial [Bryobacteraceae bacterium]